MKATTNASASILTTFTPEQLAALSPEQLAALANVSVAASLETSEATKAPKAPKPEAPKAPKPEATKAGNLDPETWTSYRDADGAPHMGKAKNLPSDARDVKSHANQGKALQRVNALRKAAQDAPQAPQTAPEAPKPEAAPADVVPADLDERAQRIAKKNAAIIATAPEERRSIIENKLKQAHKAGYPYARLVRNKHHQMDGLHLYPGAKGHGRDAAFKALVTKAGEKYRAKADAARADGKPAPKQPARVWYWSPVGGGNLYIRGIFGDMTEA